MSDSPTTGSELSPLDQIRQIETEIAAHIAAARVSAGRSIAEARSQVTKIKNQAREMGLHNGQVHYQEIVDQAEAEARLITNEAQSKADSLRQRGLQLIEMAVLEAFYLVSGQEVGLESS